MRLAMRLGPRPDRIELGELAVIGRLVLGPDCLHGPHVVAHPVEAVGELDAVIVHLVLVPARADAEDEAAVLERLGELGDVDAVVGREIERAYLHHDPPIYFFGASTWPPKPNRMADSTFSAKVCSWRERKRTNSDAARTSAGTASSMAA